MKWKISRSILVLSSLCLIPLLFAFDLYVARQQKALKAIKEMIAIETFPYEQELLDKKWKLEKIDEKRIGEFSKISYRIECQEPLLLEEIKSLLHHPELFSNLIDSKSHFCSYEKIFLDRSQMESPHQASFEASWCCFIPAGA